MVHALKHQILIYFLSLTYIILCVTANTKFFFFQHTSNVCNNYSLSFILYCRYTI